MSLTVEEMLQIGVLSDVKILAGEQGLSNRIVKTVVVIDVPNAGQWVRGGEFLLRQDIFSRMTLYHSLT